MNLSGILTGSGAAEARGAHNPEVAGSTPASPIPFSGGTTPRSARWSDAGWRPRGETPVGEAQHGVRSHGQPYIAEPKIRPATPGQSAAASFLTSKAQSALRFSRPESNAIAEAGFKRR